MVKNYISISILLACLGSLTAAIGCPGETGGDTTDSDRDDDEAEPESEPESEPSMEPSADGFVQMDEELIMEHVDYLASDQLQGRDEGTDGGTKARRYIIDKLETCGVKPQNGDSFEQAITTGSGTNILGIIEGTDPALSDRVVIASAHYDHIGVIDGQIFNGAMDNAAAVGALIQLACGIADSPTPKSVVVAFWDAEEPPTFLTDAMGSAFFAANPTLDLDDVDATVVMDLLGTGVWDDYQKSVGFGTEYSPEVRTAFLAASERSELKPFIAGLHLFEELITGDFLPLSDYDAFRNREVPVVFLADGQNKRYHSPNDTADRLDSEKLELEGQFLYRLVEELGNASETPTFDGGANDYLGDAAMLDTLLTDAVAEMANALGLSSNSQSKLESDAAAIQQVLQKLDGGATANSDDIGTLRLAMQRIQCYGGTNYPESICSLF